LSFTDLKSLQELELAMEKVKSHFGANIKEIFLDPEEFTVNFQLPEDCKSSSIWRIESDITLEIQQMKVEYWENKS